MEYKLFFNSSIDGKNSILGLSVQYRLCVYGPKLCLSGDKISLRKNSRQSSLMRWRGPKCYSEAKIRITEYTRVVAFTNVCQLIPIDFKLAQILNSS